MYENIHEEQDLSNRLETLKQTGSVINYSVEFKAIATTLGIDDKAKYIFFKKSLKDKAKKGLAYANDIDTVDDLSIIVD